MKSADWVTMVLLDEEREMALRLARERGVSLGGLVGSLIREEVKRVSARQLREGK